MSAEGESTGNLVLRSLDRSTLWDQAYQALREAMLAGQFAPGQRVVLRDVAADLGTSLTPVRDAVNRLTAEGVLERGTGGQGGGATVPLMNADHFRELVLIRSDLEGRAAAEAAVIASAADIAQLEARLEQMRGLIAERRLASYLDLHRRFHFDLYALSRMRVLPGLIENLWLRCGPVLTYVIPHYVLELKGTDLHAAALAALRRQDPDAAAEAIRRDIAEAGAYIAGLVGPDGWIAPPDDPTQSRIRKG